MEKTIKEYSLFDFEPVTYTEEEIQEAFALLVQRVKEKGNYFSLSGVEISDIKKYFQEFNDRNWLSNLGVRRDLIHYHTVDEIVETIEDYVVHLLDRIDDGEVVNWNEVTWRTWNKYVPCVMDIDNEKSQKMKMDIWKQTQVFSKKIALKLGLKHYMENPISRGTKTYNFNSKGFKKHLIPYLEQKVAKINDFDEMKEFFNCYFLAGRRDQILNIPKGSSYKTTPHPFYVQITVTDLDIVALCETDKSNVKAVLSLVLQHVGSSYAGYKSIKHKHKRVQCTPTFTYQDYIQSLSSEDTLLIYEDIQRLNRLHGKQ
jgi:hypothetical protein